MATVDTLPDTTKPAGLLAELDISEKPRTIRDINVAQRIVPGVLRQQMTVEMRHSMPHDQVVDLPRLERVCDRSTRPLHIRPEAGEVIRREICEVRDVIAEDHERVPGMRLVP